MKEFEMVSERIETEEYRDFRIKEGEGGVVVFSGEVREWSKGIGRQDLEYEGYIGMGEKKLAEIGKEIEEKWAGRIRT
ncbi:molybdenum cofactor biosynthesis protein MoaE, partial [Staphylococcus epidermidis]|uniref:molybdenum cofactor biosynthesis protein MoaE n=1 Tax=Staphylococcus epidermidis TaxID=1282 RepID=UPI0011A2BBA1